MRLSVSLQNLDWPRLAQQGLEGGRGHFHLMFVSSWAMARREWGILSTYTAARQSVRDSDCELRRVVEERIYNEAARREEYL